jgi:AraC-like DNA-binding protein
MRPDGIAGVLRSHLQATIDNATLMLPSQQILAMDIAMQLALAALSEEADALVDAVVLDDALYHGAKTYIARCCTHLATSPLSVACYLNCSRSALYRSFAKHGERVSACIWQARLAHAKRLLNSDRYRHLQINEIAFRSGFADHSTFDRMFKRAYGMKPKEMHQMGW